MVPGCNLTLTHFPENSIFHVVKFNKPILSEEEPMKCPVCLNPDLVMTERQGIEIDYCPTCRGIWLDRGELDKIIDRSATTSGQNPMIEHREPARDDRGYRPDYGHGNDHHDDHHDEKYDRNGHRRKKSFLGDIFDF